MGVDVWEWCLWFFSVFVEVIFGVSCGYWVLVVVGGVWVLGWGVVLAELRSGCVVVIVGVGFLVGRVGLIECFGGGYVGVCI